MRRISSLLPTWPFDSRFQAAPATPQARKCPTRKANDDAEACSIPRLATIDLTIGHGAVQDTEETRLGQLILPQLPRPCYPCLSSLGRQTERLGSSPMADHTSSESRSRVAAWLKSHPFSLLGRHIASRVGCRFFGRRDSEWEQVYVPAADRLWKGEDIYRMGEAYLYPPFMALSALPFLAFPSPLPRFLWFVCNAICLLALLRWSWQLAGGGRLEGQKPGNTSERVAAIVGLLCGITYLQNCLAHQQTDVVIGAMLIGGCLLLGQRPILAAATAFGLAAACKCTALLFAPYLIWRGRPLAAGWCYSSHCPRT